MLKTLTSTLIACTATALLGSFAMVCAADAPAPAKPAKMEKMEPTKEMREKMAAVHEQMAKCLRSDKSVEDCHHEMMKAHETMDGAAWGRHEHDCDRMMRMHKHMEQARGAEHDATK
jgi:hypothetical protein